MCIISLSFMFSCMHGDSFMNDQNESVEYCNSLRHIRVTGYASTDSVLS